MKSTTKQDIGLAIKYFRKKAGFRQVDLAKRINPKSPTKNTISRIERGVSNYRIDYLFQIAKILKCDVLDFFDLRGKPSKTEQFEEAFEEFRKRMLKELK